MRNNYHYTANYPNKETKTKGFMDTRSSNKNPNRHHYIQLLFDSLDGKKKSTKELHKITTIIKFIPEVAALRQKEIDLYENHKKSKLLIPIPTLEKISLDEQNEDNNTLLILAASYGEDGIVFDLLMAKANPNIINSMGCTALEEAALNGHFTTVEILLYHGANIRNPQMLFQLVAGNYQGKTTTLISITTYLCEHLEKSQANKGAEQKNSGGDGSLLTNAKRHLDSLKNLSATYAIKSMANKSNCFFKNSLIDPVKKFHKHIISGEQSDAKQMLELNANLLLNEGSIIDHCGQEYFGTGFLLALTVEDREMCEMMLPYFDVLKISLSEQIERYNKLLAENNKINDYDFDSLAKKLYSNKHISECEKELDIFRKHFEPKGVIKGGMLFKVEVLIDALKVQLKYGDKPVLYWNQVIGYLERLLPAGYLQAICQGLFYLDVRKQPLNRHTKILGHLTLLPLDSDQSFRLGYHFALGKVDAPIGDNEGGNWLEMFIKRLTSYVEKNREYINNMCLAKIVMANNR